MLTRADDLASMTVLDEHGDKVELGTLWRDRPAVLVFLRHFGWIHCREHVVQLHREIDSIRETGAEIYVIGNGSPSFIAGFRDETHYDGAIYTDPSLAVFAAAQLKRGVVKTLNLRALGPTIGAFMRGHRQGRTQGDAWQQGGVLVIAPDGEVKWHHASDRPGDNAAARDIVAALR